MCSSDLSFRYISLCSANRMEAINARYFYIAGTGTIMASKAGGQPGTRPAIVMARGAPIRTSTGQQVVYLNQGAVRGVTQTGAPGTKSKYSHFSSELLQLKVIIYPGVCIKYNPPY